MQLAPHLVLLILILLGLYLLSVHDFSDTFLSFAITLVACSPLLFVIYYLFKTCFSKSTSCFLLPPPRIVYHPSYYTFYFTIPPSVLPCHLIIFLIYFPLVYLLISFTLSLSPQLSPSTFYPDQPPSFLSFLATPLFSLPPSKLIQAQNQHAIIMEGQSILDKLRTNHQSSAALN